MLKGFKLKNNVGVWAPVLINVSKSSFNATLMGLNLINLHLYVLVRVSLFSIQVLSRTDLVEITILLKIHLYYYFTV